MAPYWTGHEGPRPRVAFTPGSITISRPDLARHERARERAIAAQRAMVDQAARYLAEHGEHAPDPAPTREITAWSRKSRANMVKTLCSLDYSAMLAPGRAAAMITLTYPGDWLTVAPDGKTVKGHLLALRKRYERAWDEKLATIWKLEFQRRGAPHWHLLMIPPYGVAGAARRAGARRKRAAVGDGLPFPQWLSATWADIVSHPDPVERMRHERAGTGVDFAEGLRASDPRRVAVYFLKHGGASGKEYQHVLPAPWRVPGRGPGRWWGYWHLSPVVAAREVPVGDAIRAARILRRWSRAQGVTRQVRVPRIRGGAIRSELAEVVGLAGAQAVAARRPRYRSVRRPVERMSGGTGWVAVNDGAAMGSQLARALAAWD